MTTFLLFFIFSLLLIISQMKKKVNEKLFGSGWNFYQERKDEIQALKHEKSRLDTEKFLC